MLEFPQRFVEREARHATSADELGVSPHAAVLDHILERIHARGMHIQKQVYLVVLDMLDIEHLHPPALLMPAHVAELRLLADLPQEAVVAVAAADHACRRNDADGRGKIAYRGIEKSCKFYFIES